MNGLPLLHRLESARIVLVGAGTMADAKRRLVERAGGTCVSEAEAHQARLGFVALEDEREAEAATLRLKRLGLLVNVADRPDLCDFTLPSVLERGPITIAVATGGASAGLAKQLRLALERMLPSAIWPHGWRMRKRRCAIAGPMAASAGDRSTRPWQAAVCSIRWMQGPQIALQAGCRKKAARARSERWKSR